MFLSNINQAIDLIGQSKFVDDKIVLELNDNASFFLYGSANFERIYGDQHIKGLLTTGIIGLILKKDPTNSVGDEVNPELLEKLKKKTVTFLPLLAKNWVLEDKKTGSQITLRNRCKEAKQISYPHCILSQIAELYNLTKKVEVTGFTNGVIIEGEPVDVLQFTRTLRWEAIHTNSSAIKVINLLMCAKNGDEYFSAYNIPTEIIEKIVGIISTLIAPNPITNIDILK